MDVLLLRRNRYFPALARRVAATTFNRHDRQFASSPTRKCLRNAPGPYGCIDHI
jgi:hypothetical protein